MIVRVDFDGMTVESVRAIARDADAPAVRLAARRWLDARAFDALLAALRPLEGQRVRLTYKPRGASGFQPQRSGVLTFWRKHDVEDPLIDGHGGFFYGDGSIVKVERMERGRYREMELR